MKRIIFPNETGISILIPADCGLSIEQIAAKDVPVGLPYLILDSSEIPQDREFRGAWEADFSQPHGLGGQLPFQKQEVIEAEFKPITEPEQIEE
jgi:hypothetical protein